MANINDSKNWGFETRQLHIGQEKADPVNRCKSSSNLRYNILRIP